MNLEMRGLIPFSGTFIWPHQLANELGVNDGNLGTNKIVK